MEAQSATPGPTRGALARPGANTPSWGDLPIFHAAWLFALGIVLAKAVWLRPPYLLLGVACTAILCGMSALRAQRMSWVALAPLWMLLGAWCAEMEPQPTPAPLLHTLSDGLLRSVEAVVVEAGPMRAESEPESEQQPALAAAEKPTQRIDLKVSSIEYVTDDQDAQVPASGNIRVSVRWPSIPGRQFRCGDRVRAFLRPLPPDDYRDPGAWSREQFLLDQGITSSATTDSKYIESVVPASARWPGWKGAGDWMQCQLNEAQRTASNRLLGLPLLMRRMPRPLRIGADDAVMLAAMVTGDRTFLAHSLRVGFERTGSFHMLVVSGFHLAIMSGCIFWLAKQMRLPRFPATLLTIAASFAYALFTGFALPVQRSLWMVTLYLVGRLVYRERNPVNVIGFAALCLLAASPRSLFDSGFQMTLLAVVSIGGVASPLLESTIHPYLSATRNLKLTAIDGKLSPRQAQFRVLLRMVADKLQEAFHPLLAWRVFPMALRWLLRIVELVAVACVVELAMTLPMAIYFHRITIFALPVNLLILPLLLVLMPAAVLTLLVALVWPAASVIPGAVVALLLHFGVGMVHLFGSLALGDFRIPGPLAWQIGLFFLLLGIAMVVARGGPWQRRGAWAALLAGAIIAILPRPAQHPQDAMLVEAIDVGQGDSLLLITPDGKSLLVDGGGLGGGPRRISYRTEEEVSPGGRGAPEFDIGEEVVSSALWARGIHHLDAVALSHAHSDHMEGLPAVLRNFRPGELWVGNNPHSAAYDALLREAAELRITAHSLRAGDAIRLGSAQVTVLAPRPDYQPGASPSNNDSLVLRVAFGRTSVLFEGDAEAPIEEEMLANGRLPSTLLKVGHHGSLSSTRPEFLAGVAPEYAVISCGRRNRFGHPRPEVLGELQQAGVRTFSTDINGATCFRLNGTRAFAEASCDSDLPLIP